MVVFQFEVVSSCPRDSFGELVEGWWRDLRSMVRQALHDILSADNKVNKKQTEALPKILSKLT